jgi:hypothetical protein
LKFQKQIEKTEIEKRKSEASDSFFRNLSVIAGDILTQLRAELNDDTKKESAINKLQRIVAELEKDKDVATLLDAAGAYSKDTDGAKLRIALMGIRTRAAAANNNDILIKINQAINIYGKVHARYVIAYGANDIDSLKTLELSCERDEGHLFAKIVSLQLSKTSNGEIVTAATYEESEIISSSDLSLVEYTTDADEQSQKAMHLSRGETLLLKGEAYIKNRVMKVLVFRGI